MPADLRRCLEACLSEPASPEALERHLPSIREIIIRLLQGLKAKQTLYRQRQAEAALTAPVPVPVPVAVGTGTETSAATSTFPKRRPLPPPGPSGPPSPRPTSLLMSSAPITEPPATPSHAGTNPSSARSSPTKFGSVASTNDPQASLRRSDALERRASKRFSAYAFNKMGAGSGLLAALGTTTPSVSPRGAERLTPQSTLPRVQEQTTGARAIPTPAETPTRAPTQAAMATSASEMASTDKALPDIVSSPTTMPLFFQVHDHVHKVSVPIDVSMEDRGLSLAQLRMIFVHQFSHAVELDQIPDVYIKDPTTGVAYLLENMDDVQPRSVLLLRASPKAKTPESNGITQLREDITTALQSVMHEIHTLKAMYATTPRKDSAVGTPILDADFQRAGDRLMHLAATAHPDVSTGDTSGASQRSAAYAHELKRQYEALQHLRNDFAVLRQVQDESEQDMRQVFAQVREQVHAMHDVVALGPSAGRNLVESGKTQLDAKSQAVLTSVEDLQDVIEDLKLDVGHRGVKPKPMELRRIQQEIAQATQRLHDLEEYMDSVRPSWKRTWESELQTIVDEQEFLHYQEGLLADLKQDHTALQGVFASIQQVVRLRDQGPSRTADEPAKAPRYVPPPPDEEHQGLHTVMVEVRGQSIDHERRLRALQAAERAREKAKTARTDEFMQEIAEFADTKGLRRTGGHLEAERIRQKRDQTTLRAMWDA